MDPLLETAELIELRLGDTPWLLLCLFNIDKEHEFFLPTFVYKKPKPPVASVNNAELLCNADGFYDNLPELSGKRRMLRLDKKARKEL